MCVIDAQFALAQLVPIAKLPKVILINFSCRRNGIFFFVKRKDAVVK